MCLTTRNTRKLDRPRIRRDAIRCELRSLCEWLTQPRDPLAVRRKVRCEVAARGGREEAQRMRTQIEQPDKTVISAMADERQQLAIRRERQRTRRATVKDELDAQRWAKKVLRPILGLHARTASFAHRAKNSGEWPSPSGTGWLSGPIGCTQTSTGVARCRCAGFAGLPSAPVSAPRL